MENENLVTEEREFNYRELCTAQSIDVEIPTGTLVMEHETGELIDMLLKTNRMFNRVEKIRQMCINELQFAQQYNGQIRGPEFTNNITNEVNDAFKYLDAPAGLMQTHKKLLNKEISVGYSVLRNLLSTPLNITYTQLKGVLVQVINLNAMYQKFGSDAGYRPFLDLKGATAVLEKTVHIQNYLYDMLYVLGTVLLTSLSAVHGKETPIYLKKKLTEYELFEGEGDATLSRTMVSFKPESRFILSEGEDIIFNF